MNPDRGAKLHTTTERRAFWQRLVDAFFGYDFFISYAHIDGKVYAEALAQQMSQSGFECFLDSRESFRGDDWLEIGYWALKRTKELILVGTPGALQSLEVLREVRAFSNSRKKIVPIDFDGSLASEKSPNSGVLQLLSPSILKIRERSERLDTGPSASALEQLAISFRGTRQRTKRRNAFQIFLTILVILLLFALFQTRRAQQQRTEAYKQLAAVSWSLAEIARDQESDPLKATHYFLSAAALNEKIGNKIETENALFAAQLTGVAISRTIVNGTPLTSALLSPDGTLLLTSDEGGDVQLWNMEEGSKVGDPNRIPGGLWDFQFNRDGSRILTFSENGIGNIRNGTNAKAIGSPITNGPMGGADFSPDGKMFLTWGGDNTRVWSAIDGAPLLKPLGFGQDVWHATFDSEGRRILSWSTLGKARVWTVESGAPIGEEIQISGMLGAAFFYGKGDQVLTWADNGAVQLWNLTNRTAPTNVLWQGARSVRRLVGTGGGWIYERQSDGTAQLWKVLEPTTPGIPHRYHISSSQSFLAIPNPGHNTNVPSYDQRRIKLWNSEDRTQIAETLKSETEMDSVTFSVDDSRIATCSRTGKAANLWNAESGQRVGQPLRHTSTVNGAAFSLDSRWILTWSEDGTAKYWDAYDGSQGSFSMTHKQSVSGGYFVKHGTQVLTWSADGTARLWNIGEGKVHIPTQAVASVNGAMFDKRGERILIWGGGAAELLNTRLEIIGQPMKHTGEVWTAMLSPDERLVLTLSADGTAKLWNSKDGTPVGEPMAHKSPVIGAVFCPNSSRVLTWSSDRRARLWRTTDAKPIGDFIHPVLVAQFSKDGQMFVTSGQDYQNPGDQFAQIWSSLDSHAIGPHLLHSNVVVGARFTPDGQHILTQGMDAAISLWDEDGKRVGLPMILKPTDYRSNWINEIEGVAFSPNGREALIWNNLAVAQSWDLSSRKPVTRIMSHRYVNKEGIVGGVFSPDGLEIMTWGADGVARLWNAKDGGPIGQPMIHATKIKSAIFDASQKRILTLSEDGVAKLWRASDGTAFCQPLKHQEAINGGVFSSDGSKVLTWSDDATARLWDADNGQCIGIFKHEGAVVSACFSPDEKLVLTGSRDGRVSLWNISFDKSKSVMQRTLEYEVRSGTRLSADGELKVLSPDEWNEAKAELARTHSNP